MRTIEPTLTGLSTASATTRCVPRAASSETDGRERPLEDREQVVGDAVLRDQPAEGVVADEHLDLLRQAPCNGRRAIRIAQRHDGAAPRSEGSLDDEVALCDEPSVAAIVAALDPVGQSALVEPEHRQPGIVGIVGAEEPGHRSRR